MNNFFKIWFVRLIFVLIITGCAKDVLETPTPEPTQKVATQTPTTVPTMTPSATPTVVPTPTATVSAEPTPLIITLPGLPPLSAPIPDSGNNTEEADALLEWLLAAWDSETEFGDVGDALEETGWVPKYGFASGGVDRDEVSKWLVNTQRPHTECIRDWVDRPCGGDVWIIGNDGLEFRFLEEIGDDYLFDMGPELMRGGGFIPRAVEEVYGHDFMINIGGCGAHTCWNDFFVFSSVNGTIQNIIELPTDRGDWGLYIIFYHTLAIADEPDYSPSIKMTYSEYATIDINGDGRRELILEGGHAGSVGSGFQRTRTEVWGWTGSGIGLIDLIWHAPITRLHRLWEASDLYDMVRFEEASTLFMTLVGEKDFENEDYYYGPEDEPQRVAYFSAFRLALLGYVQQDAATVYEWVAWLERELPQNHPYREAGQRLQAGYNAGETVEVVCLTVVTTLNKVEDIHPLFLPSEPGYGNPAFTTRDLCPHGLPLKWGDHYQ